MADSGKDRAVCTDLMQQHCKWGMLTDPCGTFKRRLGHGRLCPHKWINAVMEEVSYLSNGFLIEG